jgi:hypothetical protein
MFEVKISSNSKGTRGEGLKSEAFSRGCDLFGEEVSVHIAEC